MTGFGGSRILLPNRTEPFHIGLSLLTQASDEIGLCPLGLTPKYEFLATVAMGEQTATHVTHNARTRMLQCGVWP